MDFFTFGAIGYSLHGYSYDNANIANDCFKMKQTFVSYTSRRASSNCHILIWIAIATRRANMGCRNTTWSPLSACLTSKLSIIDSVTLTLSSSLSLALSLSHSLTLPSSLTLYYHFQTHTLSLCHFHWLCIVDRYCCPSLTPTLYLQLYLWRLIKTRWAVVTVSVLKELPHGCTMESLKSWGKERQT